MFARSVVVLTLALLAAAAATHVQQCEGRSDEGLSDRVQLKPCKKLPCPLKKGKDQHITVKFTPEQDISEVTNHVTADVFGVSLPFVGVDGTSICDKITLESGEKASCPLVAGTTYIYKDSFHIHNFYPNINVKVHWALQHDKKKIVCFQVPAEIVGRKQSNTFVWKKIRWTVLLRS